MAVPKEKVILPPLYYLDYFRYVCDFVRKMYPDLIGPQQTFIDQFFNLSQPAQCLYLRMNIRKGIYFRVEKMNYEEIEDVLESAEELVRHDFARWASTIDPLEELIPIFTKQELENCWNNKFSDQHLKKGLRRSALEEVFFLEGDASMLLGQSAILTQQKIDQVELLKIMFFGQPYGDLNQFVARDVGNVLTPFTTHKEFKRLFSDRSQIDQMWEVLGWYELFKFYCAEEIAADQLWLWLEDKMDTLKHVYDTTRIISDKLTFKAGHYLEQCGELPKAIDLYALSQRPEAFRRRLMVLNKIKNTEDTYAYAQWLSEHGKTASLKILGKDYCARMEKRAKILSTTDRLKRAARIPVIYQKDKRIEHSVLEHFNNEGYQGFFSENYIWRSIFGMMFWDILYDFDSDTIHQPLQRIPSDLYDGFYKKRQHTLKDKLSQFDSSKEIEQFLLRTVEQKRGMANPFVHWHDQLPQQVGQFSRWLTKKQIDAVLIEMAKNPKENATGFPDLFVFNDQEYAFYEVKSPNDHLSAQQLFWISFFEDQSINVDILKTK